MYFYYFICESKYDPLLSLIYFPFCRPYNLNTTAIYNQWYIHNTRTLLSGPPPTELTQDEQVRGPEILSSAYHHDSMVLIVF
jgi:hypothetical protein